MGRFASGNVQSDLCFKNLTLSAMEGMDFRGARKRDHCRGYSKSAGKKKLLVGIRKVTGDVVRKHCI